MTKKQAIADSIAHWERMVQWAKEQPKEDNTDYLYMFRKIKEGWYGDYCALCHYAEICDNCPTTKASHPECNSMRSTWKKVSNSKTWGEWVKNAEKMLKLLKSLGGRK